MMKIIGITGGIGSGKSTVSAYLKTLGFAIIDLDEIARNVLTDEKSKALIKQLSETFGDSILKNDILDRKELAKLAFANEKEKAKLDHIMLPPIIEKALLLISQYQQEGKSVVFLDAPLLFETKMEKYCTDTWLIHTEEALRINRVISRKNTTFEDVKRRIALQMNEKDKIKLAGFIIDNNKDNSFMENQIKNKLKEMDLI